MTARHTSARSAHRRWIRTAVLVVLLAAAGMCACAVLSGAYQVRPVLSGSMRPGLPVGGVVITKRVPVSSLQVRDVIVFHRPDDPQEMVVHRIVSLTDGPNGITVQTQGDANNAKDPWTVTLQGTTAYRAVYTVPLVGYAAVWMHNPTGRGTLIVIGGLLLVGVAASGILRARRRAHETEVGSEAAAGTEVKPENADLSASR